MAKNKTIIMLCCILFFSTAVYSQKPKKNNAKKMVCFVEKDSIKKADFWLLGYMPKSRVCVISNPETAAIVASEYVANIYGEKLSQIEQPYSVAVLNDSLWYVSGTSKPQSKYKQWKGSFSLIINKYTGQLVTIMHEK